MMLSGTAEMRSCKFCRSSSVLYAASAMRYAICARVQKCKRVRKAPCQLNASLAFPVPRMVPLCASPALRIVPFCALPVPRIFPSFPRIASSNLVTLSVESQICLLMFHGDSSLLICCEGPCNHARQHNQA